MDSLLENWFFLLVLLACVAMHFFGDGHGHGGRGPGDGRSGEEDSRSHPMS